MLKYQPKTTKDQPDSLPPNGILGHTKAFMTNKVDLIEQCSLQFNGIAALRLAMQNTYVISDPDYIYHVLQKKRDNYPKSDAYDEVGLFFGNGILTSSGDTWFKNRRIMQPAFNKNALLHLITTMHNRVLEGIEFWKKEYDATFFDSGNELRKIAADIVTRSLFSKNMDESKFDIGKAINDSLSLLIKRIMSPIRIPLWIPTPQNNQINKIRKELFAFIDQLIEERKNSAKKQTDLLQTLMDATDEDTGEKMSDKQLRDEIITLYIAGQETTQHALTFAFDILAKNPKTFEKLRNEALSLPTKLGNDELKNATYSKCVVDEILRLFPPAWIISRQTKGDDYIGEYFIPKKSKIIVSIIGIQKHPKYWKNSNEFNPERFLEKKPLKNTYIPFGSGSRVCIGNNFAIMEMQLMLIELARHFDKIECKNNSILEVDANITMSPKNPVFIKLHTSKTQTTFKNENIQQNTTSPTNGCPFH